MSKVVRLQDNTVERLEKIIDKHSFLKSLDDSINYILDTCRGVKDNKQ